MNDQTYVVKQYKDTVFRLLFKKKDKLTHLTAEEAKIHFERYTGK